jgi:hypothetical protein
MITRAFESYGNTTPYVVSDLPVNLLTLDGYAAGAGWLQFHDLAAAPTGAEVPMKSLRIPGATRFAYLVNFQGAVPFLLGCCLAMSSAEEVYTPLATSFDAYGEVEEVNFPVSGLLTIGDLTTARNFLRVWTQLVLAPKVVFMVDYVNNNAFDTFVLLYTTNVPGAIPDPSFLASWKVPAGQRVRLSFGDDGLRPSLTYNGVPYVGCSFFESTSGVGYVAPGTTLSYFRAYYKEN